MGTIQNSMNQMLGTIAGASTLGKHISNQNKELKVKKIEAEKELENFTNELKENTSDITHQMVLEGKDKALEPKEGETPAEAEERAVQDYLDAKSDAAENRYQELMDKVKNPAKSIRVEMARKAADEAQDAINARRDLKFNLDIATEKYNALKSNTMIQGVLNDFRENRFKGGKK